MGIMSVNKEILPYRPCAGIMLVNLEGKVFVGQRLDSSVEAWQLPQGGIDDGVGAETQTGMDPGWRPCGVEKGNRASEATFWLEPSGASTELL